MAAFIHDFIRKRHLSGACCDSSDLRYTSLQNLAWSWYGADSATCLLCVGNAVRNRKTIKEALLGGFLDIFLYYLIAWYKCNDSERSWWLFYLHNQSPCCDSRTAEWHLSGGSKFQLRCWPGIGLKPSTNASSYSACMLEKKRIKHPFV